MDAIDAHAVDSGCLGAKLKLSPQTDCAEAALAAPQCRRFMTTCARRMQRTSTRYPLAATRYDLRRIKSSV